MAIGKPGQFGTAIEDAMRRDYTINSMFYNINERKIEDFTGNGIKDMENKVIRTSTDPVKLFTEDDCLPILRAIRFANRFDYQISEDIVLAV
jgi:tRNA nucleotidyltransferase (CCA-adding enzyme)